MKKDNKLTRRNFIANTATAAAGITILPSNVIAGFGHKPPSDKLNIAGIGVGGMGHNNLRNMETENIVALCDVDRKYAGRNSFTRWPLAKKYMDYREMFDTQKNIDAVLIATPDHSHALPAIMAMREGYHVYVQKPLTHSWSWVTWMTPLVVNGSRFSGIRSLCCGLILLPSMMF